MLAEKLRNDLWVRPNWSIFRNCLCDLESKLSCTFQAFFSLRCGKLVNKASYHTVEVLQVSSVSVHRINELLV